MLLSINRFERKKGIGLAVEALHVLLFGGGGGAMALQGAGTEGVAAARLILAGGYDARLAENRRETGQGRQGAKVGIR